MGFLEIKGLYRTKHVTSPLLYLNNSIMSVHEAQTAPFVGQD
jgi:hypothetical protein